MAKINFVIIRRSREFTFLNFNIVKAKSFIKGRQNEILTCKKDNIEFSLSTEKNLLRLLTIILISYMLLWVCVS